MVQDGIPELTLERYRAAVRVQYGAGNFSRPVKARMELAQAVGLARFRGHEAEWRDFWEREEDAIMLEVPKVLQP